MKSLNTILQISLYYKLLAPVVFIILLGVFMLHHGAKPDPVWSVFDLGKITSLDLAVWVMIFTGLTGFLLGSWIWIMQPRSLPALLFGVSGIATLAFTFSPIPNYFRTPVSADMSGFLAQINIFGASLFGIVMCGLLMIYPSRLPYHKILLPLTSIFFLIWTLWASLNLEHIGSLVQLITFVEMLCIVALSFWQIFASRTQADKRAISIWLSACVIVGSGPFIALVAVPETFGHEAIISAHYAFAFFNLVYIGFAAGLMRLQLFNLGSWAFQLLFHAGLAVLFVVIDVTLMSTLTLQQGTALVVTAFGLATIYLPIRGWLSQTFSGQRKINEIDMFQSVIETGLKPSGEARALSWVNLLKDTFKPLQLSENPQRAISVSVASNGESLSLPAAMDAPPLILRYKYEGRALFGPKDQMLATQMLTMINQVDGTRRAYDRGVNEERSRIGRDIHDNIGAQLLQALHSKKANKKDEMIRGSLSDLRNVINNSGEAIPLADMLADLRAETADRVDNHDIKLTWNSGNFERLELSNDQIHTIRSVLREAVSNILKHAQASRLDIQIHQIGDNIQLCIKDNGKGMARETENPPRKGGHGLKNMRERVVAHGGTFSIQPSTHGTQVDASFKIETAT